MKILSKETETLLDKLYNLRSEDSYILAEMEKEKEVAEETKEKTLKQKEELQEKIESLTKEESVLADQGAHLREILSGIDPDDFKMVLNRLNIDFNPAEIKEKIDELLPATIEEVVSATKKAEEELVLVEDEMNSAITKIDELAVRKETELANQEKLNEYFDLALSGNINITREAITSLVSQFNFSEEEQREAAKLMMFPEDALYEYDKNYQDSNNHGKSISDVLIEAKESVSKPIGDIFNDIENEVNAPSIEENNTDKSLFNEQVITDVSDIKVEENSDEEKKDIENNEEKESISDLFKNTDYNVFPFEINADELKSDLKEIEVDNTPKEEVAEEKEEDSSPDEETMVDLFKRLGLNEIMFVESELEDLINLDDKEIVEKNVNILNKHNINLDIVSDNVNILSDPELDEKINLILSEGKTTDDIYFNPSVLKKYNYKDLENAINLLKENGLDPKKVPLMAY